MKNILSLLFILTFSISVNAQYESVFGTQETSWKLLMSSTEFIELEFVTRTHSSDTMYDTIVNGETYKRYTYSNESGIFQYDMKEDTVLGKVWMGMLNFDTTMYLKFDLSLNVGDTFYFHNPIDTGIVQSVFYQNNRKHIEFDIYHYLSGEPILFVEGVGPTTGFVDWIFYHPSLEYIGYLVCQEKDGAITYVNAISNDCNFAELSEFSNNSFKLHPNPIRNNVFSISLDINIQREDITIYDAMGKQLQDIEFKLGANNTYEISLPKIQAGVYHVHINTPDGLLTEKIIVL